MWSFRFRKNPKKLSKINMIPIAIDTQRGIFFRNGESIGKTMYSNMMAMRAQMIEIKILIYGPMDKGMDS